MKRPAKKAERARLRLTDREVADVRAVFGVGSSRQMLKLVDRIAASHAARAIVLGDRLDPNVPSVTFTYVEDDGA